MTEDTSAISEERRRLLEFLCDNPFLSISQLGSYLELGERAVQKQLKTLKELGWVRRYNMHQPDLKTRSVFTPTAAGAQELARLAGMTTEEFLRQKALSPARLERLSLLLERVHRLRNIFLVLRQKIPPDQWRPEVWDVEVQKTFHVNGKPLVVPFHAAAIWRRSDGRWLWTGVEFDLRRVPVEKEGARLRRLVLAQNDPCFLEKEQKGAFPVLLIIAQDALRLGNYYAVLRAAAQPLRLPLPSIYLTTFAELLTLRGDWTKPIWYSTVSGQRTSLLFDERGMENALPSEPLWERAPAQRSFPLTFEIEPATPTEPESQRNLASLALSLSPLEKRLLDEIAAHPLLPAKELMTFLWGFRKVIPGALKRLLELKLIEAVERGTPAVKYYLPSRESWRYLAMRAGFGEAVRRYIKARGWGRGADILVQHWEHTRAENEFWVHLARIAQERGHELLWLSELESRLYYDYKNRRHSFLPDGRGTYIAKGKRYEIALEIDRSRASREKIRRKIAEYLACVVSNVLRGEGIEFLRVLFVTTSWERAEMIRQIALTQITEMEAEKNLPVYITTHARLKASGADAAIWLPVAPLPLGETALGAPKTYCLDCFVPGPPPPPRKPGVATYISI